MSRLALVMVVRDDAELAERALRSADPFVDESIVLDLGTDEVGRARLMETGARVEIGTWTDDASACRNAALDLSDADWNLVLDPEEWLATGGEELTAFTAGDPDRVGLVEIRRAPGSPQGEDHPWHLAARLLPRGVRYQGAYREEPVFDQQAVRTDVLVLTDDTESGRWRTGRERAEALLRQGLVARPGSPTMMRELADLLRSSGRYAEAAELYSQLLEEMPSADPWRHAVVVAALESCIKADLLKEAVALMDAHAATWAHSPDFAFLVGELLFEIMLANPTTAAEVAPLVDQAWRRAMELGERPDLSGALHGRGSFLAAQNLYVLNLVLGRTEQAEQWADRAATLRIPDRTAGRLLG